MIPPDIQIVDLGALNYPRLFALLAKKTTTEERKDETRGSLLLIYRGLKLLYSLDLDTLEKKEVAFAGVSRLKDIAEETGYSRIIAISDMALMRIFDRAGRNIKRDEDFLRQSAAFLDAILEEMGKTIFLYPGEKKSLFSFMSFFLKRILPMLAPREAIVFFIITDREYIWSSIAFGFRKKELSLITTLDSVVPLENAPRVDELDRMIQSISKRYDLAPRYVVIERSAAERLIWRRFNPAELLLLYNRAELRTGGFPKRWRIYFLILSLAMWFLSKRRS